MWITNVNTNSFFSIFTYSSTAYILSTYYAKCWNRSITLKFCYSLHIHLVTLTFSEWRKANQIVVTLLGWFASILEYFFHTDLIFHICMHLLLVNLRYIFFRVIVILCLVIDSVVLFSSWVCSLLQVGQASLGYVLFLGLLTCFYCPSIQALVISYIAALCSHLAPWQGEPCCAQPRRGSEGGFL